MEKKLEAKSLAIGSMLVQLFLSKILEKCLNQPTKKKLFISLQITGTE